MNTLDDQSQAPLSIGLVTPGWPADAFPNGIVTYVATIVPALRKWGHKVSVIAGQIVGDTPDGFYGLMDYGRSLPARMLDALTYRLSPHAAVERMHRRALLAAVDAMDSRSRIDVLEMEESFGSAAWVCRSGLFPVCVRLHGPWFLNGAANGSDVDDAFQARVDAERAGIVAAAGITAPSMDVLEKTREFYGLKLPEAEVIPYPVTPPLGDTRWSHASAERHRILFVGRFDRHKGGDLVIEAFAHVLHALPDARLTFVGPDRGYITEDGRSWGLVEFVRHHLPGALESGRVELLGQQPLAALKSLRLNAAVTVVASRYETFCYAAAEAMTLGCPVVATRAGAIPEFISHGSNGLLCGLEDPSDMAAALLQLLSDADLCAELGRQAALDCERLFHPDVIASRTVAFYRRLLART